MGIVSIQLIMGFFLGPMLGGIIYDKVGWYGVFELGFVFLGLDIALRLMMIEKHVAAQFQPSSNMTEEQSLPSEAQFLTPAKGKSTKSPEVIRLLKYPRMIAGMWLALAQATIISAFDAALPLHLNRLFGWTSFQAGISPFPFNFDEQVWRIWPLPFHHSSSLHFQDGCQIPGDPNSLHFPA
jgi:MFS family permease